MKIQPTNIFILTILLINSLCLNGQEGKTKRANANFENYAFMDAIASYEDLVDNGLSDEEIYKKLGDANYMNAKYDEASEWYGKLVKLDNINLDPDYYYRYAQTLKSLGNYEESDLWMEKFQNTAPDDLRLQRFEENKQYLEKIKANSGRYAVKNLALNSSKSDFSPSFYGEEGLVFSTARDSGKALKKIHKWNKEAFLNLYTTTIDKEGNIGELTKFSKNLNTKTHESSTAFTKDRNTIYFTRNNSNNGSFSRDDEGVSRLKIYRGKLIDGKWNNIEELPFNSDDYSVAHPSLSQDEKTLYFSSDMPGTLGLSDIFKVAINDDGSFGTPQNLGKSINTEGRETFPFIHNDILYFVSDGHPGLGGLDIFGIDLKQLDQTKVQNLGKPLNSEQDDFSFIINDAGLGYFASNRDDGVGSDDIYSFLETEALDFDCYSDITGIVKDKNTKALLPDATLNIKNEQGEVIANGISDANGAFSLKAKCNEDLLNIKGTKTNFNEHELALTSINKNNIIILLEPNTSEAKAGEDLTIKLNLAPIYFDFDKSYIRKDATVILSKVLNYMEQYPNAKIEVRSHTDSRANDSYNISLSQRRAKATYNYLVQKGVNTSRLSYKGFGETELTNECDNNTNCSSEKHQQNRRSEFIVVE
jgi:outer membrane protein OmpA-like peptidoglycan-associated protein